MKNIIYIFFIGLLFSCSNDPEEAKLSPNSKPTSILEKDTSGLVIAFYFNDSLKEGFIYYNDIDEEVSRKNLNFQKELQRKSKAYEDFVKKKGAEAQQGFLSENEMMKVQQKAQQLEADIVQYQQREGANLEAEVMQKLTAINNKVKSFGKKFSEANGIDLLMGYADGGQINFINPKMDVTHSFIEFLNKEQKSIEEEL
ncbi:MAG: OmpH family outer membrane protein [Crocinitomicaceae bacterium]